MRKIILLIALVGMSYANGVIKQCTNCHGVTFEKAALGKSKIVSEMTEKDIITSLKGYKDGSYGGVMKGVMKGQVARLSDADIEDLAKQIKNP